MKYDRQYDDIINMEHHVSKVHPQMSLYARSAQFAPFAALTGYEDSIKETGREVSSKIEIDEELKNILDSKLQFLMEKVKDKPKATFTYFVMDLKKDGGAYITKEGIVNKIDIYSQVIHLADNTEIPITDIIDISGDFLKKGSIWN